MSIVGQWQQQKTPTITATLSADLPTPEALHTWLLFNTMLPEQPNNMPYDYTNGYSRLPVAYVEVSPEEFANCIKNNQDISLPGDGKTIILDSTFISPSVPWTAGAIISNLDELMRLRLK